VTNRLSLVAALALAVCFVLPLSTCTRYVDEQGKAIQVERGEAPPEGAIEIVDQQIAAEQLWTNPLGGVLMLICFVGPLAIALYLRRRGSGLVRGVLFWVQPLLLVGAAHFVWVIGRWGETAPGAWIAAAAIASVALAWVATLLGVGGARAPASGKGAEAAEAGQA
jgi:hypothetical protein